MSNRNKRLWVPDDPGAHPEPVFGPGSGGVYAFGSNVIFQWLSAFCSE